MGSGPRPLDHGAETLALPAALLRGCGIPGLWRGTSAWRVLDCDFSTGANFAATLAAWQSDAERPRTLHYVSIADCAPSLDTLCAHLDAHPGLGALASTMPAHLAGVMPGFQRFALFEGHLQWTLCIGAPASLLREQQFIADSVFLGAAEFCTDRLHAKPLARVCRRGTRLAMVHGASYAAKMAALQPLGFRAPPRQTTTVTGLEYEPAWRMPPNTHAWREPAREPADCVVLGAGLAGSAVASALALRGWEVTVLDAAPSPAGGASALPAGLMAMPLTRDDAPRSRLARAGIGLTLQACRAHLVAGRDWQPCGALDLDPDHRSGRLPTHWPAEAAAWCCTLDDARVPPAARRLASDAGNGVDAADSAVWHAHAAWVRPSALVQAWLSRPGVRFCGGCTIIDAWHDGTRWQLRDIHGAVRASARHLVLCLAGASVHLLQSIAASRAGTRNGAIVELAKMQAVSGTLSGGVHKPGDATTFPTFAVQGAGHFQAHVPSDEGPMWWTGATFEPYAGRSLGTAETRAAEGGDTGALRAAHGFNLQRLRHLLPGVAHRLEPRFASGELRAWSGVRCATVDRLPAVGPLQEGPSPELWTSTGMGARGLSYAALCAELLAAQMCGEPLPVEATLALALRATRPRLRAATRVAAPAP